MEGIYTKKSEAKSARNLENLKISIGMRLNVNLAIILSNIRKYKDSSYNSLSATKQLKFFELKTSKAFFRPKKNVVLLHAK